MTAMRYLIFIFCVAPLILTAQEKQPTISGRVVNKESGEALVNCNVFIEGTSLHTVTDKNGRYLIVIPFGKHEITFSFVGFKTQTKKVSLRTKTEHSVLDVELEPQTLLGKEMTIMAQKEQPATIVQEIKPKDIVKMPNIYSDVLRSVQIFSGVSSNNELSSGYNVRGGTFDENLIYINGYEIYRPFLLRQGVEENQSLVNPEMVSDLKFFNGAFPARFGDKMSSALKVQYSTEQCDKIHGIVRADLLNMGLSLRGSTGNLNWKTGFRLAYPSMFMDKLQTRGDYKPSFSDIQGLANYSISPTDKLEFFFVYALNKYDLSPKEWDGQYQTSLVEIHQVSILEKGNKDYSFGTNLAALKYQKAFEDSSLFTASISRYYTSEREKSNVAGDVYYSPDAYYPEYDRGFLFRRTEDIDDKVTLNSFALQSEFQKSFNNHSLFTGIEFKAINMVSDKNEFYVEEGKNAVQVIPVIQKGNDSYNLNSFSIFAEDKISLSRVFNAVLGIRYLNNSFTKENLFSPRLSAAFIPDENNAFTFGAGVYYQPPFVAELTGLIPNPKNLKSQRAIHVKLGWQHQLKEKVKMNWEFYYKKLDYLIPFYYEDLKTVYVKGNVNEGYSYGFDVMFQGQISDGIDSWLGYGYLNSKEREIGSNKPWRRRLLDQTHTIQIFLQDRFKKHQNWQSHLRILAGSGFLYNPREMALNPATQKYDVVADLDHPQEYFLYLRADMGLSATFDVGENSKLMFVAEILNVFNHYNIAGYESIRIFNDINGLIRIPKVLSKRFFNLKIEFYF